MSSGENGRLPVEEALPSLKAALGRGGGAVLVAPPGAGKTTRVPLALLGEPWAEGKRILMLEPRRLAARSAARYMASALGEQVGQTVGYRVRMDSRVGPKTRIEVITEGILTRMLQEDPELAGVAAVLFDEFHERSLHADLGLALCLQAQELLNSDLKLVVMSATLEAEPVAALMGEVPVVVSTGRAYPVETRYAAKRPEGRLEDRTAAAVAAALRECQGDILVFLPGAGEIRRTEERLLSLLGGPGSAVQVLPLHGSLPQEAQDRALAPGEPGTRKVVLATSIAETSLTVDGVRVVVDAGLSRVPRFSPRTGMTRLDTVPVSVASADQRRGRAGRQGPGVCYRLWPEQDQGQLPARTAPEILEADLAPLCLELAAWGAAPEELRWLDAPPAAALAQARGLLRRLGALGADGAVTPHGRAMAGLGLHPRLAHMALKARELGLHALGCELAALLGERDVLRAAEGAAANADLRLRVEALRHAGGEARSLGLRADPAALARVRQEASWWRRELDSLPAPAGSGTTFPLARPAPAPAGHGTTFPLAEPAPAPAGSGAASPQPLLLPSGPDGELAFCGLLLAFAYPDRIGQQRSRGRYLLSNGRGAVMAADQPLAGVPYLVAAELDDQGADSRIYLAAPVELDHLETYLKEGLEEEEAVEWEEAAQAVRAKSRVRLGALILREKRLQNPPPSLVAKALLAAIAKEGLEALPWTKTSRQLLQRLRFMHLADPSWPDVSEETLLATLPEWLGPYAEGLRSKQELARLNLGEALTGLLDWSRRQELDRCAPTHLQVPSGSRIPVDYSDPGQPYMAVRLQELFGLTETPRIGGGRVSVVIHLLSPAQRPVQVTRDLAGFWRETYFEVKKDLKGRYPKHYWPDNPLEAVPTNRVRPKPQS
ncbi:ATP-dependent helicase HrpB [Paenibacillus sp. YN15]|uniref:ATP-dependent helicase HrpB n=1 Tax=Paenibacillus sp. YN15 TaxID=1742774 RepID=UPI000DCD0EFF|nr:ATP-dependent helicase HrpB [Paenibacillus sp. YN15]RAU99527.1 ATP-dependent helicase HrpB [Paenibacillus sp. YN15]